MYVYIYIYTYIHVYRYLHLHVYNACMCLHKSQAVVFFCVGVCARAGAVFDRTQASELVSVQQRQQERGREQDRQCTCASVKDTASEREKARACISL